MVSVKNEFANGINHINGIENFGDIARLEWLNLGELREKILFWLKGVWILVLY